MEPLIHGGKSITAFRSGTPPTALIVSMAKALRLSYENMDEDILRVKKLTKEFVIVYLSIRMFILIVMNILFPIF